MPSNHFISSTQPGDCDLHYNKVLNKLEGLRKHFLSILEIFTNVSCSSKLISNSNSKERENTRMGHFKQGKQYNPD